MKKLLVIVLAVGIALVIFWMLGFILKASLFLLKWIIFGIVAILVYQFLKDRL